MDLSEKSCASSLFSYMFVRCVGHEALVQPLKNKRKEKKTLTFSPEDAGLTFLLGFQAHSGLKCLSFNKKPVALCEMYSKHQ